MESTSTLEVLCESAQSDGGTAVDERHTIQTKLGHLAIYFGNHSKEDVIIYAGDIGYPSDRKFSESVINNKEQDNVFLILATYGGVPDSAFRMARVLQQNYEKVTIYVNDFCKSSGTLLAIGADQIVMGSYGEFGPLDIQLVNKDEFNERNSGLDAIQALSLLADQSSDLLSNHFVNARMGGRLGTKQALEVATNTTIGLLSPIYGQLEPLRLGEISRSMRIAYDYGHRLNTGNLKANALQQLIGSYPSHGYVIDEREAEDRIFNNVRRPEPHEEALWEIMKHYIQDKIGSNEPLLLNLNEFIEDEVENAEKVSDSEEGEDDTNGIEETEAEAKGAVVEIGTENALNEQGNQDEEQHASNE